MDLTFEIARRIDALQEQATTFDEMLDGLEAMDHGGLTPAEQAYLLIHGVQYAMGGEDYSALARYVVRLNDLSSELDHGTLSGAVHVLCAIGAIKMSRSTRLGLPLLRELLDEHWDRIPDPRSYAAWLAVARHQTGGAWDLEAPDLDRLDLTRAPGVGLCGACIGDLRLREAFDRGDAAWIVRFSRHVGEWQRCKDAPTPVGPIALWVVPAARAVGETVDHLPVPSRHAPSHLGAGMAEAGRLLLLLEDDVDAALSELAAADRREAPLADDIAWLWWYAAAAEIGRAAPPGQRTLTLPTGEEGDAATLVEVLDTLALDRARSLDTRAATDAWRRRLGRWRAWMRTPRPA
jgi:hypothetical protein